MIISNQNNLTQPLISRSTQAVMTVFEHQRLRESDFSQASDFAWLIAQELTVFSVKRQRGQWQLKVGHYIGIILLPSGTTLEILPKLINKKTANVLANEDDIVSTRQWVQNMLADLTSASSNKRPHTKHLGQLSDQVESLPLQSLPLSQWLLIQFLQQLAVYQPTSQYQPKVLNQTVLQGKLLIKQQLHYNRTRPCHFISEVSVLSQDMLNNRIIKSALLLLEPLLFTQQNNQHSQEIRTLLLKAMLSWRQLKALQILELQKIDSLYLLAKQQLSQQPLPKRQLQSAQQLLDLSYWLLKAQLPHSSTGNHINRVNTPTPLRLCLLINMNQAFEQWASRRIGTLFEQLSMGYRPLFQAQHLWLSDATGETCLSMRPDVLIHQSTVDKPQNYSHVLDIKWKKISQASDISASDAYQLTSYAQAYQTQQVWLVYPVTSNERPVLFQQHVHDFSNSNHNNQASLWLMPFNVLTGTLNHWPHPILNY